MAVAAAALWAGLRSDPVDAPTGCVYLPFSPFLGLKQNPEGEENSKPVPTRPSECFLPPHIHWTVGIDHQFRLREVATSQMRGSKRVDLGEL